MYEVWALDIIKAEVAITPSFTPPVHAQVNAEVLNVGNSIKRLYAYAYQVLPFIYTHLVSSSCTLYLIVSAAIKGLEFQPDVSYTFGLFSPLAVQQKQKYSALGRPLSGCGTWQHVCTR